MLVSTSRKDNFLSQFKRSYQVAQIIKFSGHTIHVSLDQMTQVLLLTSYFLIFLPRHNPPYIVSDISTNRPYKSNLKKYFMAHYLQINMLFYMNSHKIT